MSPCPSPDMKSKSPEALCPLLSAVLPAPRLEDALEMPRSSARLRRALEDAQSAGLGEARPRRDAFARASRSARQAWQKRGKRWPGRLEDFRQGQITADDSQEWRDQVRQRLQEAMRGCRLSLLNPLMEMLFSSVQVAMWSTLKKL